MVLDVSRGSGARRQRHDRGRPGVGGLVLAELLGNRLESGPFDLDPVASGLCLQLGETFAGGMFFGSELGAEPLAFDLLLALGFEVTGRLRRRSLGLSPFGGPLGSMMGDHLADGFDQTHRIQAEGRVAVYGDGIDVDEVLHLHREFVTLWHLPFSDQDRNHRHSLGQRLAQLHQHIVRARAMAGRAEPVLSDDRHDDIDLTQRAEDHGPEVGPDRDRVDVPEDPFVSELDAEPIVQATDEMGLIDPAIRQEHAHRPVIATVIELHRTFAGQRDILARCEGPRK